MKILLIVSIFSVLIAGTATAWENNQPADLVLGRNYANAESNNIPGARGFAIDPVSGKVFVSEMRGKVRRYPRDVRRITGVPPEAVLGKPDLFADPVLTISDNNLVDPAGLEIDGNGRLWVADRGRILRWDGAATKASGAPADGVLGGPDFTSVYPAGDPRALSATMRLGLDNAGNLYVSCEERNSILRFDAAASKPNGAQADAVFGQPLFTGTENGTSATRLFGPREVILHGTTLWVLDAGNRRILRLNNAATRASGAAFDALLGQESFFLNTATQIATKAAIAVSPGGRLMISQVTTGGPALSSWPNVDILSGLLPSPEYTNYVSGINNPNTFLMLHFEGEGGLWLSEGISDQQPTTVRRYTGLPTQWATSVILKNTFGFGESPWQAAVDPASGKVFISYPNTHVIRRFADQASLASHAPPEATFGNTTNATAAGLSTPRGICIDGSGRLWVADSDHHRVLRWDNAASVPSGAPASAVLGQPDFTSEHAIDPPNEVSLYTPYAVAVDAGGTLWVVDNFYYRALRFDNAATKSGLVPADGILGKTDYYLRGRSQLPGSYYSPAAAQIDHAGRLWVMDTGYIRLFRYNTPNSMAPGAMPDATIDFGDDFGTPDEVAHTFAVTPDNVLWVAGSRTTARRINRFDNASTVATGAIPDGQIGQESFGKIIGGLSTDAFGNLWVPDPGHSRVMRFSRIPLASPGAPGRAVGVKRSAAGLELQFTASLGGLYFIESSEDLSQWTPVDRYIQAVTPLETLTDPVPGGANRYYRARLME